MPWLSDSKLAVIPFRVQSCSLMLALLSKHLSASWSVAFRLLSNWHNCEQPQSCTSVGVGSSPHLFWMHMLLHQLLRPSTASCNPTLSCKPMPSCSHRTRWPLLLLLVVASALSQLPWQSAWEHRLGQLAWGSLYTLLAMQHGTTYTYTCSGLTVWALARPTWTCSFLEACTLAPMYVILKLEQHLPNELQDMACGMFQ